MADMELRVNNSFKNALIPVEFNYLEIKTFLEDSLAKYKGRVFDDAEMAEAKKISADINRISKQINDTRIQVKKQYLSSFETFENQCKELVALCNDTNEGIREQINAVAEAKREQKMKLLQHFFKANCKGDAAEILSWERIADKKWGNATSNQTETEQEILRKIDQVNGEVEIIRELESPFEIELLEEYRATLNLNGVFAKKKALEERKKAADERRKQVEAMLGQKSGQQSMFDTKPEPPKAEPVQQKSASKNDEIRVVHFLATGTLAQFKELRIAVDRIGIKVEKYKENK